MYTADQTHLRCYICPMWQLRQIWSFGNYLVRASTPAQIHSPYLFELLQFIHDKTRVYYAFDKIEWIRMSHLNNDEIITGEDYGAGSKYRGPQTVQRVTRTAVSSPLKCQTIFRLVAFLKPERILELGTSLGIMTAYLASANTTSRVTTIEGNPRLNDLAKKTAHTLNIENIAFYSGQFSELLPEVLKESKAMDFVLIDGDHRGEALSRYFSMIMPALSEQAVVMVDDIRWSADMFDAWKTLSQLPAVTCSLDYFSFGLLFFRKDFLDKVHLQIIPRRIPPTVI